MNNSFEKLVSDLEKKVSSNFSLRKISDNEFEFKSSTFLFKILWQNSSVILLSDEKNKLCEWSLEENATNKDISSISNDFCEFMIGRKERKIDKNKNEDENSDEISDITFDEMVEKVLQFFPDERSKYESQIKDLNIKDKVLFLRDNVIGKIDDMSKKSKQDNRTERLFKHLGNSYVFGDKTTKCVVSMLFFNGITGAEERKKVRKVLPFYLRKTWDFSWKVRGNL